MARYRTSYSNVQEQREAYEAQRARKRARKKSRQVKAHKRRIAGKVVHVKAYCRRPVSRHKMPF